MALDAGSLNRRISLEKLVTQKDSFGQVLRTDWVLVRKAWASIKVPTGVAYGMREGRAAGQQVSAATRSFRIRWCTDVLHSWRVTYDGKIYDILQVLPDEAGREYVDLACAIGANNG